MVAAFVVALVSMAAACSTEEPLPPRNGEPDATEDSRRVGSLLAEFERTPDGEARRARVHAQFLDVKGLEVERALKALEVWSANRELGPDSCSLRTSSPPPSETDRDLRLDLLSVGTIGVQGPEHGLELEARRLPDLVSSFSGVIYGTDQSFERGEEKSLEFEAGGHYTFRAEGDGSTGGFDVTIRAPEPVEIREHSGTIVDDAVVLGEGRAFEFAWNRSERADTSLYFDVSTGHGPDRPQLKCRLEDDGSFAVPADLVGELAEASSSLHVSLRRISATEVDIGGLQRSRFTVSTVDELAIRVGR